MGLPVQRFKQKSWRLSNNYLTGEVPQQHGIRLRVAALESDLRTVGRKRKLRDSLRREMCQLPVRRTIQRLEPEIVHAFFVHRVSDRLAIRREFQGPRSALIHVVIPG